MTTRIYVPGTNVTDFWVRAIWSTVWLDALSSCHVSTTSGIPPRSWTQKSMTTGRGRR